MTQVLPYTFCDDSEPKVMLAHGLNPKDDIVLAKNTSSRKANHLLLLQDATNVRTTCLYQPSQTKNFDYYLAIYSAKDGRVKVCRDSLLFDAPQRIVKSLCSSQDLASPSPQVSYSEAQNQLGEAFGTRKRKQALSSLGKNQINTKSLETTSSNYISRSIDSKSSSSSRSTTPLSMPEATLVDNGILPPFNPSAKDPSQIYPSIIPPELFPDISRLSSSGFFTASLEKNSFMDRYVGKSTTNLYSFLYLLINLACRHDYRRDGSLFSKLPKSLVDNLTSLFMEEEFINGSSIFKFSSAKKDKLISYICAACLSLDANWSCNVYALSLALQMPVNKLTSCLKTLGCKISTDSRSNERTQALNGTIYPAKFAILAKPPKHSATSNH
jgi:hypothetical protein